MKTLRCAIACLGFAGLLPGADNQACGLATPAEVEAATGLKVAGFMPSLASAGASICSAAAPAATVMLRIATSTGVKGREEKGIEIAKKMGAQVEVKTFGSMTCSTFTPPANLAQYGFNTTCSVVKGDAVAAIEVTAKAQKDMVPIENLRPLAEKIATRF